MNEIYKFENTDTEVAILEITHINNESKVPHLIQFIGKKGRLLNYIRVGKVNKYKLQLLDNPNEQHYFEEAELELVGFEKR